MNRLLVGSASIVAALVLYPALQYVGPRVGDILGMILGTLACLGFVLVITETVEARKGIAELQEKFSHPVVSSEKPQE